MSDRNLLSGGQILGSSDLPVEDIPVEEWGGTVRLRAPSVTELDEWDESVVSTKVVDGESRVVQNLINHKARLLVKCLVNEDGDRLFKDTDAEELGKKSSLVIGRLYDRAIFLAGRDKKQQKSMEGNSKGEDGSSLSSSSPGT